MIFTCRRVRAEQSLDLRERIPVTMPGDGCAETDVDQLSDYLPHALAVTPSLLLQGSVLFLF